ncbi:armadillo-type protein [Gorgonomyces haynaldii]|nr:armadillo-type protein [Gorgonomyces haynaldii]
MQQVSKIPREPMEPFAPRSKRPSAVRIMAEARASLQHPTRPFTPALPRSKQPLWQKPPRKIVLEPIQRESVENGKPPRPTQKQPESLNTGLLEQLKREPQAVLSQYKAKGWPKTDLNPNLNSIEVTPALLTLLLLTESETEAIADKLYGMSQDESFDTYLREHCILDALLDYSRRHLNSCIENLSQMTIVLGIIQNITSIKENVRMAGNLGLIEHLGFGLWTLTRERLHADRQSLGDYLNQLMLIYRNLCADKQLRSRFVTVLSFSKQSPLEMTTIVLEKDLGLRQHHDLMLNLARIHSKLSLDKTCVSVLESETFLTNCVEIVAQYYQDPSTNAAILTRLFFTLGNLTSAVSPVHMALKPGLDYIMSILEHMGERCAQEQTPEQLDLLIKTIRLISNLTLDPSIGRLCTQMIESEKLLDLIDDPLCETSEELLLNVCGCLANVTFYLEGSQIMYERASQFFHCLVSLLMHDNEEVVVEACRIIANLLRDKSMDMSSFNRFRTGEVIGSLLSHPSASVKFYTAGMVINICIGTRTNAIRQLHENHAMNNLYDNMQDAIKEQDWDLAQVSCQALYSMCQKIAHSDQERQQIVQSLQMDLKLLHQTPLGSICAKIVQ